MGCGDEAGFGSPIWFLAASGHDRLGAQFHDHRRVLLPISAKIIYTYTRAHTYIHIYIYILGLSARNRSISSLIFVVEVVALRMPLINFQNGRHRCIPFDDFVSTRIRNDARSNASRQTLLVLPNEVPERFANSQLVHISRATCWPTREPIDNLHRWGIARRLPPFKRSLSCSRRKVVDRSLHFHRSPSFLLSIEHCDVYIPPPAFPPLPPPSASLFARYLLGSIYVRSLHQWIGQ